VLLQVRLNGTSTLLNVTINTILREKRGGMIFYEGVALLFHESTLLAETFIRLWPIVHLDESNVLVCREKERSNYAHLHYQELHL